MVAGSHKSLDSFNTVNGRYCWNVMIVFGKVSLNQLRFNTVNGRYCCNLVKKLNEVKGKSEFQYRKR